MSGKVNRLNQPPMGKPWAWLTAEIIASDAFHSLSRSGRLVIDFLLLEHMSKGGQKNGKLKAPHRQLYAFGIGEHQVVDAIREVEEHGLVDCYRGGMRVATTYGLTWLPLHDGTPATDRWRSYRDPKRQGKLEPAFRPKEKLHAPAI
jgi:hypothetical protein